MRIQRKYWAFLVMLAAAVFVTDQRSLASDDEKLGDNRTLLIHRMVDAILETTIRDGHAASDVGPYLEAALIILDAAQVERGLIDPSFDDVPAIHELLARPNRFVEAAALNVQLRARLGMTSDAQRHWLADAFGPDAAGWSEDQHPPRHQVNDRATMQAALALGCHSSVQRSVHRLVTSQEEDGSWSASPGLTRLESTLCALLTLTAAPEPDAPTDACVRRALDWLRHAADAPGFDRAIIEQPRMAILLSRVSHELGVDIPFESERRRIIETALVDAAFSAVPTMLGPERIERMAAALSWLTRQSAATLFDVVNTKRLPHRFSDPLHSRLTDRLATRLRTPGRFRMWNPADGRTCARVLLLHGNEAFDLRLPSDQPRDLRALQAEVNECLSARRHPDSNAPSFSPSSLPRSPMLAALREAVHAGATIVAVDESVDGSFSRSVFSLGTLLFPQHTWQRRMLKDADAHTTRRYWSLENGVRPVMMLMPRFRSGRKSIDQLAATLVSDVFDRWRRSDGTHALCTPMLDAPAASFSFAVPTVARAVHAGHWNPEPGALRRLRAQRRAAGSIPFRILHEPLITMHETSPRPDVAIIAGSAGDQLHSAELRAIRACLDRGMHVIVESNDGDGSFGDQIRALADEIPPDRGSLMLRDEGLSFLLLGDSEASKEAAALLNRLLDERSDEHPSEEGDER